MNKERVEYCIRLMRQAKNLKMSSWQGPDGHIRSIEQLHDCGNTACFAGYVALSPKFQEDGGAIGCVGEPVLDGWCESDAIAEWLDISRVLADKLVYGWCDFYEVPWGEIKPKHVIAKLKLILAGELT